MKMLKILAGGLMGMVCYIPISIPVSWLIQTQPIGGTARAILNFAPFVCQALCIWAGIRWVTGLGREQPKSSVPVNGSHSVWPLIAGICVGLAVAIPAAYLTAVLMALPVYLYMVGGSRHGPLMVNVLFFGVPIAVFLLIAIALSHVTWKTLQRYLESERSPGPSFPRTFIAIGLSALAAGALTLAILGKNRIMVSLFAAPTPAGSIPIGVALLPNAKTLAVGADFVCALLADGHVSCWGGNTFGQLGVDAEMMKRSPKPLAIADISNAVALRASDFGVCALLSGGSLQCWGRRLVSNPVLADLSGLTSFSFGRHLCGIHGNGRVQCLGGDVDWQNTHKTPVPIPDLDDAVTLSQGEFHDCALTRAGTVRCWGNNRDGERGDGTTADQPLPAPGLVSGISDAVSVVSGSYHNCAIIKSGRIECWGQNSHGQLGDGTTVNQATPVVVAGVESATALAAGTFHTCALVSGGRAMCWGGNFDGEIGDGKSGANRLSPSLVNNVDHATAIAAGNFNTCALLPKGEVRCWGKSWR